MALLPDTIQTDIKRLFEQLSNDVKLIYFTQRESPLHIPGHECETCKDTHLLLEEVSALTDKVQVEVHDFVAESGIAKTHGIDKIPAIVMTAEGVKGKVRYFGMPAGYEFSVLLGSLIDVSQGKSDLAAETLEAVDTIIEKLHIQVFTTPT